MIDNKEKSSVLLCDQDFCLGCMACRNVCPKNAIQTKTDIYKNTYPFIQEEMCISCGLCRRVCPVICYREGNNSKKSYACYTKDEYDRNTCSSGGVATTLYHAVLAAGGLIVGAIVNGKEAPVLYITNQNEDIEHFKGSKYVCADPQYIYREIENELKKGKIVLFIGTPCQVDALNHFLMNEYTNLFTVDIICHGTPPYEYLNEYLNHILKNKSDMITYSFRGKNDFFLSVYDENKRVIYKRKSDEDLYFLAYLKGIIHREICYQCPYAQAKRISDITIGDYWEANTTILGGYKGKISAVMINTDKGMRLWDIASSRLVFEETEIQAIIKGNNPLRNPSEKTVERKEFLEELCNSGSFISAINTTTIPQLAKKNRIDNIIKYIPRKIRLFVLRNILE